ncbi:hypothetical protein Cantr_07884 [Candida viswanathii]|uniref:C2 domain-containing protein n=1 Tax=Candida viswanathii TaxID=5486 RepID=A0A367XZ01_9ASCO|nr:hypothetical protein Cantr_07884 [Candida viswanathii]
MYSSSHIPTPDSVQFAPDEYEEYEYPVSADGTLVVMVVRAKHLPNRRKLDKQSPYVVARIGIDAQKTEADFRAGQTPEWMHEMRFVLSREKKPILKIDVLDETKADPTPIGSAEIDASVIFTEPDSRENGKYIYDRWFDLNFGGKRAGMISLEMTFYPSAPMLPPKVPIQQHLDNVVVVNEPDYDPLRSSARSSSPSKYKDLPTAPFSTSPKKLIERGSNIHPSRSAADDVFVTLETSNGSKSSSVFLRKFLKSGNVSGTSSTNSNHSVFVSQPSSPGKSKGHGKYTLKLSKFADKFQSKQPVSTLWKGSHESVSTPGSNHPKVYSSLNMKRSVSPLSDYEPNDLDQLQRDISVSHINYHDQVDDEDDDDVYISPPLPTLEFEKAPASAPAPPPHLIASTQTASTSPTCTSRHHGSASSSGAGSSSSRSPRRKPPPPDKDSSYRAPRHSTIDLSHSTAIPFSADSIGADDDDDRDILPTQVYMLDEKVKSLSVPSDGIGAVTMKKDEIDPKFYAPTPSTHFNKSVRLQNGSATREDLRVDLRTSETGYLGNGSFSPSIFERAVRHNWDEGSDVSYNDFNKPQVPPKIPNGLTEQEFYVLEREKFLKDMSGNRY